MTTAKTPPRIFMPKGWRSLTLSALLIIVTAATALAYSTGGGDGSGGGGGGGGGGGTSYPPQPTCPQGDTGSYVWNGTEWVNHCTSPVITPGDASLVIAVTNSQSMDGTTSGAIMTGSGFPTVVVTPGNELPVTTISSFTAGLGPNGQGAASPLYYPIQGGFVPPMGTGSAPAGMAPYTLPNQNGNLADNGPSRMNMVKAAIHGLVNQYASKFNFALTTYSETMGNLYTTYAYYLPPSSGKFWFTNTWMPQTSLGGDHTIDNPCYSYTISGDSNLSAACGPINNYYKKTASPTVSSLSSNKFLVVGPEGDDSNINDILYSQHTNHDQLPVTFLAYGGETGGGKSISSSNPYWNIFTLNDYNQGMVSVAFKNVVPKNSDFPSSSNCTKYACLFTGGAKYLSPTNSAYLPSSGMLWYIQRGMGFYSGVSADTGATMVNFVSAGQSPTAQSTQTVIDAFKPALQPESSNGYGSQMKSLAGQSPIAGLLKYSGDTLDQVGTGAQPDACAGKYIILITDGLPTQDLDGHNWPPPGTPAADGFGMTVHFNSDGSYDAATSNDGAATDAIDQITSLLNKDNIKTYVIGVGAGVDPSINPAAAKFLKAMAIAGGTQKFYPANDQASLNVAIQAIGAAIESSVSVAAPVAPTTLPAGGKVYQVTSNNNFGALAGHVQAFNTVAAPSSTASAPIGTISGNAVWDAGDPSLMPASTRAAVLYSTDETPTGGAPDSGSAALLKDLGNSTNAADLAAFDLPLNSPSVNPCLPNDAVVASYTIDPSYTYTYTDSSGNSHTCNYGADGGRAPNWMLGSISPNDAVQYLGPPGNALLLGLGGYVSYARTVNSRARLLLFTSNDGILYGINASSGQLAWGWTPRSFLQYLQNYPSLQTAQYFDGQFTPTDAVDTATNPQASDWSTYVVGTAQGGAYHYALKLKPDASAPLGQAWGISTPGGTSPQMQAPIIVTYGGMQYAVFVVNTQTTNAQGQQTTISTLYEVNVATGKPSTGTVLSAQLPFVANSALTYVQSTSTLWIGAANGDIWSMNVTGTASADVASAEDTAATTPTAPVKFVGYVTVGGMPYLWAATENAVFVYSLSGAQGQLVWTSNSASPNGSTPDSSGQLQSNPSIMGLHSGGKITISPQIQSAEGEILLEVHVYAPPGQDSCGPGSAYNDYFDFLRGGKPINPVKDQTGHVLTSFDVYVGSGPPLATRDTQTSAGTIGLTSSQLQPTGVTTFLQFGQGDTNLPIAWRQY